MKLKTISTLPQRALVIIQATISAVLLAGAALLTCGLVKMQHQDLGHELDNRIIDDRQLVQRRVSECAAKRPRLLGFIPSRAAEMECRGEVTSIV